MARGSEARGRLDARALRRGEPSCCRPPLPSHSPFWSSRQDRRGNVLTTVSQMVSRLCRILKTVATVSGCL